MRKLGIGSTTKDTGQYAVHSNKGPTDNPNPGGANYPDPRGFANLKPNIAAPGESVRSSFPGDTYGTISGTSMAAPHVTATVALLWSSDSAVVGDVEATRTLLDDSAIDTEDLQCGGTADDNNVFGEGRLDAYALIFGDEPPPVEGPAITVDPASIENTQPADELTEHTLTVGNTGTEDLDFTITENEGGGDAVPPLSLPQGTDRAHASTEATGGPAAPAVVEPAAVPHVGSLTENFDNIASLPGAGWAITNNSEPEGVNNWFQGNPVVFPAHEGTEEAYVAANFNSAGEDPGDISNWLMTPELDLSNGAELSFWTRTVENPASWADRLEVRLSTAGDSTDVGTGYEGVGDFDTVLLSVNPDLTDTGYPGDWAEFTLTIDGLEAPATGRIGFRYFVPDSGALGTAGDFIGVDTVSYEAAEVLPACETVDVPWLSADPVAGTVAPDGSQEVTVTLDSTGLALGEYTANLCVESNDPVNPVVNVPVTLTVGEAPVEPAVVQRIFGEDRWATAGEIAAAFPDGVDTVYIANGTEAADGADALAAGAAGAVGALEFIPDTTPDGDPAPILLVKAEQIPQATWAALEALTPAEIIIVGGPSSVSAGVESDLAGTGADVRRIAGENRYETAALIGAEYGTAETVFVATGQGDMATGLALADALTAASVAGSQGAPVLLTRTGTLPAATAEVISDLGATQIVVVGGPDAVSDDVLSQLNAIAPTERVAGDDRYTTAAALTAGYGTDGDVLYVASGVNFPDALAGSSLTGSAAAPLLLTRDDHLPAATAEEILRLSPQGITIFGGPDAVDTDVEAALQALLDQTSTD